MTVAARDLAHICLVVKSVSSLHLHIMAKARGKARDIMFG